MLENLYTTKMSANKKSLKNRFAKIRSESGRIANAFSVTMLILILTTILYTAVVMAAMNEQKKIHSANNNDSIKTIISYLPQKNSQKSMQNSPTEQPDFCYEKSKTELQSANSDSTGSITDKKGIKSSSVSDELYVGLEQIILPDINSAKIQKELQNNGIISSKNESADLKKEYIVSDFPVGKAKVNADENGNISIYMSVENDNLFNVNITDSETNENVGQATILANNDNIYTFLGFEQGKNYNVEVTSETQNDWDINGSYIIY